MSGWVDWSKTTRSSDYRGSTSFATFMIIGPTCFFLGILFASFPYDFPLLWTSAPVPDPRPSSRPRNIIVFTGFLGFFIKLFRPSEANVLFDGASLVLYLIGVGVYITNIVKGLRSVILGKEDSLKVLAASNTILALVLVGVLVLQAGQWYAERKDREDFVKLEEEENKKGASSKKKQ
uniref:Secretory component protein n=1 Tax=Colletotrichum fructicola (strain Nara gc5) TaxID=1213859 RepID=L2FHU2_COLFN